ncbi:hypothetical protein A8C32_04235 [Flavivirga aquatica]|uniref:DUF4140 domain-containing protein n=1 Tax=Flavivirga aquatica TaxID=1849968 RepID=A0A1E5TBA9_9FLAO|nr:DUF4140 domain-containing protein [Flavivirga aquatica]OEK08665.1 hypothetical protein A8C32_04235 [Flavivirga aquatica]
MKNLILLFLLSTSYAFSKNITPTPTSLNTVTVYTNGAQITRIAKITLLAGTTEFKFDKLSPYIQENSIQISGLQKASILFSKFSKV